MFETQKIVRLYVDDKDQNGACLELCPNPDAPEASILLHTPNENSKIWFGDIEIYLSPEECRELGKNLIDYANYFDENGA